jgi:ubiquinone/menaquinone biosynthesis C-methylase UbiE
MKYDATELPTSYDRARVRSPEVIALWMSAVAEQTRESEPIRRILDLGCGTGRFSGALARHFRAQVVGLDPSTRMLRQAVAKAQGPALRYAIARGEELPLADGSVDLIFMSMVFHHFADPPRAAAECNRVLRAEGVIFLRAGTRDRIPSYPPSRFFPPSVPIMERTLAPADEVARTFVSAGFREAAAGQLLQEIAPSFAVYADQVAARADSVLAQLSAADLEAGVAEIRAHAARVDPTPVAEVIDWFAFRKLHPGQSQPGPPR